MTTNRAYDLVRRFGPAVASFAWSPMAFAATMPELLTRKDDILTLVICPVATFFFTVILVVSIIMILYAAYLYATAAGDATKVKQAGQTITYAALGIAVAILANSVPVVINSILKGGVTLNTCSS